MSSTMIITPQQYPTLKREITGIATDFMSGDEIEISGTMFPVIRRIFNTAGTIEKVLVAKTYVRMSVQNDYTDAIESAIMEKDSEKLEKVANKIFERVGKELVSLYGFSDGREDVSE